MRGVLELLIGSVPGADDRDDRIDSAAAKKPRVATIRATCFRRGHRS